MKAAILGALSTLALIAPGCRPNKDFVRHTIFEMPSNNLRVEVLAQGTHSYWLHDAVATTGYISIRPIDSSGNRQLCLRQDYRRGEPAVGQHLQYSLPTGEQGQLSGVRGSVSGDELMSLLERSSFPITSTEEVTESARAINGYIWTPGSGPTWGQTGHIEILVRIGVFSSHDGLYGEIPSGIEKGSVVGDVFEDSPTVLACLTLGDSLDSDE